MNDRAAPNLVDDVDPEIRQFVDALNREYSRFEDFAELPLDDRRAAAERIRAPWRAGGPRMWSTADHDLNGIRLRVYRPRADEVLPAMLYIHGGGWTMFSVDTHDRLMREYAARAGIVVVGIDYSLSPETKFPGALDEVVAAFTWLAEGGAGTAVDQRQVAIGGDSAGANLAVTAAVKLRQDKRPMPAALLLNYGAFDPRPAPSYRRYGGPDYMLTVPEMEMFWDNYVRQAADRENPLVAPIFADLHALPPTFMAIAECDILADGNHAMAERFRASGVDVMEQEYVGATHSFLEAMSISTLANRAIDDAARWLSSQLG